MGGRGRHPTRTTWPWEHAPASTMTGRRVVPGDGLLHPVVLASIAVLVVNDHVLKPSWPGLFTGKLSDFAGLLFFPLLLVAAWEVATSMARPRWRPSGFALLAAAVTTAIVFTAAKATPVGNAVAASALGFAQWVIASMAAGISGGPPARFEPVAIAMDPGDLVALGMIVIGAWIGYRRIVQSRSGGATP